MGCKHCMEDSKPEPLFMKFDEDNRDTTYWKALDFMKKCNAHYIVISGGEPTEHPDFFDIVTNVAINFDVVTICSNGMFILDEKKTKLYKELFKLFPNIYMQVYTNKKYYPLYDEIVKHKDDFQKVSERIEFQANLPLFIKALGRAANDKECIKDAKSHSYTTSCMSNASIFYQLEFTRGINYLESIYHFCSPMIDWQGNIHLSESWLCPNIGNVNTFDDFNKIIKFKPCGKCSDYQKILNSLNPKYMYFKQLMNLK